MPTEPMSPKTPAFVFLREDGYLREFPRKGDPFRTTRRLCEAAAVAANDRQFAGRAATAAAAGFRTVQVYPHLG